MLFKFLPFRDIFWTLYVLAGTQACWQLLWVFYSFYWLAFLIPEQWMQRMFPIISLLIPMTIWYLWRKNVQLARFWSECIVSLVIFLYVLSHYFTDSVLFTGTDLLDPSTAAFVIAVSLGLTIIVHGWFALILCHSFFLYFVKIRRSWWSALRNIDASCFFLYSSLFYVVTAE